MSVTTFPLAKRLARKATSGVSDRPVEHGFVLALMAVLVAFGLVMVLAASDVYALRYLRSPWAIFDAQLRWAVLGSMSAFVTARLDYRIWRKLAPAVLAVCILMLLAVLVPRVGIGGGGASRWVGYGPIRMQPSELAKLSLVLYVADVLARRRKQISNWRATVRPVLLVTAGIAALLMAQPDLGSTIVVSLIVFAMLWAAGVPGKVMGMLAFSGIAGVLFMGWIAPYRRQRLLSFLDPWTHRLTSGFQVVESLVGVAGGHLAGVGLGASATTWGLLPNAYTDFIFSVVATDLGLIGGVSVLAAFVAFAFAGLRIAASARDSFGALLCVGVTAWIFAQAVINMGAVIGVLPVTGIPLPFVSYGGSSLIFDMAAVGMMLNVSAASTVRPRVMPRPEPAPARGPRGFAERPDRTRTGPARIPR